MEGVNRKELGVKLGGVEISIPVFGMVTILWYTGLLLQLPGSGGLIA